MGDLAGDSLITYKQKQEEYSADSQKSVYQQRQTNDIYGVNMFLFFIYYGFLIYYTYYTYGTFIVYPVQYGVYNAGKFIVNLAYSNVYDTNSW